MLILFMIRLPKFLNGEALNEAIKKQIAAS